MEHGVDEKNSVDFPQVSLVTVESRGTRREGGREPGRKRRRRENRDAK